MNGLHILGTGRAVPDQIITNDDLARRVDTNDEWIVARTGIRERRFAREGESLTQFTVAAARQALERAGLKPEDIGLCITATVTSDRLFPSQACLIHQELGLPEDCPAFDLSAGCTGFLYAMETAAAMLPRMNRPYALLVGGELLSRIVDMDDRSTCILFGDGAGAAVVESTEAGWYSVLGTRGDRDVLWAMAPRSGTSLPPHGRPGCLPVCSENRPPSGQAAAGKGRDGQGASGLVRTPSGATTALWNRWPSGSRCR